MLTTKETVSGLRRITGLIDDIVKRFPTLTHREIAQLLVEEAGGVIETLREDIAAAREEGKNPFQKQASLNRLEKYAPIVELLTNGLRELGKPAIVEVAKAA
jgi:hypothetical protein